MIWDMWSFPGGLVNVAFQGGVVSLDFSWEIPGFISWGPTIAEKANVVKVSRRLAQGEKCTEPKVTWENRAHKDWQVGIVPWWCRGSPIF